MVIGAPETSSVQRDVLTADQLDEWVAEHYRKLTEAFEQAHENQRAEADRRAELHSKKINDVGLQIGARVYLRDHPAGRNKIQDAWKSAAYKVVERIDPNGNVYRIEPDGWDGEQRVVNRSELKDSRQLVDDQPEEPPPATDEPEQPAGIEAEASDNDDVLVFSVADNPVQVGERHDGTIQDEGRNDPGNAENQATARVTRTPESSGDESQATMPEPRRSRRRGAGQHANPYNLPKSVLSQSEVDAEVLMNISQTQLLLTRLLAKNASK